MIILNETKSLTHQMSKMKPRKKTNHKKGSNRKMRVKIKKIEGKQKFSFEGLNWIEKRKNKSKEWEWNLKKNNKNFDWRMKLKEKKKTLTKELRKKNQNERQNIWEIIIEWIN